eukprot:jgi/Tetstr1/442655/TSEL_030749.t1
MRPQWRQEHALQEDTTTATMVTGRFEDQQDAGAEARVQQPAIHTLANLARANANLARAGVRAWAEYKADTDADDAVIRPPTRTLLAFLEVREVKKARRSADSARLELLDADAARVQHDVCRDAVLALPFGNHAQGRAVVQVTVKHSEEREDPPTTSHKGVLPPTLSKRLFQCALTAKAICTGPLATLELPTVGQLAEVIAATISQRINTPPELQHAQWLTDTSMLDIGVEMQQYHTKPTLLRVGDDNLRTISLGKEDEEFADTLRLAVALFSPVALLRVARTLGSNVRLRTIIIYLTESEFEPSELLVHPFSQKVREAGEFGGNSGHNHFRRTTMGLPTAPAATAMTGVKAEDKDELELNYEENDSTMDVDTAQRGAVEALCKGKAAACAKHKKKHLRGRSRSGGATRNRSRSKPRLSGTHDSDNEWETDDEAAQPSGSSHQ